MQVSLALYVQWLLSLCMSWQVFEPQGCEYESHLQDTLDGKVGR